MAATAADDCLPRLTRICLALPEASWQSCGGRHASFLVRKKVFAYFLNDHHGDGIVSVACKALAGDNTALAAAQPERFYLPAYIGPRGWVALRLDRGAIDWNEVAELLTLSYRLVAPKTLAKKIGAQGAAATLHGAPASDRSVRRGGRGENWRTRRRPPAPQS